jgi:Lipocalin-like domain
MAEFIKSKLIGTWRLVSWIYRDASGNETDYFGKGAVGILMYDAFGNMNAQLMQANRKAFASNAINGGTAEETKAAFDSYIAYFGKVEEIRPGEIVHLVEGSLFPNWFQDHQLRYATLSGDKLILSTPPVPVNGEEIIFHITWVRVT